MIQPDIRNGLSVRAFLEHFEDEIIMYIVSRAQFGANPRVYTPGYDGQLSMMDKMLLMQENIFSEFGRYQDPIERPFNSGLALPKDGRKLEYSGIHLDNLDSVNMTEKIKASYLDLLKIICAITDDSSQYGSSAEHDIPVLITVSQRVHSGVYVAEMKYFREPDKFRRLIARRDRNMLLEAITDAAVEERVLQRVHKKAVSIQEDANPEVRNIVPWEHIVNLYRNVIIPLTKEVQLLYFLNRRMI